MFSFLSHKSDIYDEVQKSTFLSGITHEISAINAESKNECSVNVEYEWHTDTRACHIS